MVTTAFEDSGRHNTTTLAQEAVFVDALLAQHSDILTREVLGQSVQGRDIYVLKTGTPGGRPALLLTSVHADESVAREAGFTFLRDVLAAAAPTQAAFLAERQLWVIPTPNPDGYPNNRTNANGQDINRNYVGLAAPESALIAELVHAHLPVAILDAHEWNGAGPHLATYVGMGTFLSADPGVRQAMRDTGDAMKAALIASGAACDWYPRNMPVQSIQHVAPTLGCVFSLMETCSVDTAAWLNERPVRHTHQQLSFEAWLDHLATHAADYEARGEVARARTAARYARRETTQYLTAQPAWDTGNLVGVAVTAAGYSLSPAALTTAAPLLAAHRIEHDDSGMVWLRGPSAHITVMLLDPASEARVVDGATPIPAAPAGPTADLWAHAH